jgi:ligand-binding SRPBCC domain-containing protein
MQAPLPLDEVFRFFEDPLNLARITPPELGLVVQTPHPIEMRPIEMRQGAIIDYRIRWLGLPVSWRTRITEYQQGQYFVDEQILGPFKLWRHRHDFQHVDGASVISDRVEYQLPVGIFGRIAHALIVGRQLKGIFAYRQRAIAKIFGVPGIRFTEPEIATLGTP